MKIFFVNLNRGNYQHFRYSVLVAVCAMAVVVYSHNLWAETVAGSHAEVELIPEKLSLKPGQDIEVAVRIKMEDGWHIYWKNPGDSGLPTEVQWQLPEQFQAGPLLWPYPEREDVSPLATYVLKDQIFLFSRIKIPDALKIGDKISLNAEVKWLACELQCVPGKAKVSANIPISEQVPVDNDYLLKERQEARNKIPTVLSNWQVSVLKKKDSLGIKFMPMDKNTVVLKDVQFFPENGEMINHATIQKLEKSDGGYVLYTKASELYDSKKTSNLKGILVADPGWDEQMLHKALEIDTPIISGKQ